MLCPRKAEKGRILMASTQKTPFLGLNQWLGTDKPKREDFNRDNLNTETKVRAHCEDRVEHVSQNERAAWNKSICTLGTYTGNGSAAARNIVLGFQPSVVFVYAVGKPLTEYRATADSNNVYSAIYTAGGASAGIEAAAAGFAVRQNAGAVMAGNTLMLNQQGVTYGYVALP